MNWLRVKRITKLGLVNFWRNRWLSLASALIITLTLLIISFFVIITLVIGKTTDAIHAKMDVSVYFLDSATVAQISSMQTQVASRSDVKEVRYISKEEALQIFQTQQTGKKISELITAEDNPLPRSIDISANKAEDLSAIASFVAEDQFKPIVHNISYQDNKIIIDRLIGATQFFKKVGLICSVVFILISVLVVLNTIRLAMLTRKDEVEIMRLVGASDSFIRVPFIVEGILYGAVATVLATVLIRISMAAMSPMIEQYLNLDLSRSLMNFFSGNFLIIVALEFFVAIAIGVGCSLISIRKHLKL
jgi:cell division transport system permease protein